MFYTEHTEILNYAQHNIYVTIVLWHVSLLYKENSERLEES